MAQRDDQRHLHGDDGQQQDVGQDEEQAQPEAYGASSSGALKRKPTPRTV
jgi:hypothetical protein